MENNSENNVVVFPRDRIVRMFPSPQDVEGYEEKLKAVKEEYIQRILEDLLDTIIGRLGTMGIELENPEHSCDVSFFMEAIRAAIYRGNGLEHDLHKYIDENFVVDDDGKETVIEVEEEPNDAS